MAPFANLLHPGSLLYFLVFLLIGMAFGTILEMSGFGDSRKLAAQFYFKDMTVLKVMFTAIVVAAVLIFLSNSLGLLNYDRLWVNPTFLYPEIVGGLIMGVGFIGGSFDPQVGWDPLCVGRIVRRLGFRRKRGIFRRLFPFLFLWTPDCLRLAGNFSRSRGFAVDPHGPCHVLPGRNCRSPFWRAQANGLLAPPKPPENGSSGLSVISLRAVGSSGSTLPPSEVEAHAGTMGQEP
jgi:hypothetical protein